MRKKPYIIGGGTVVDGVSTFLPDGGLLIENGRIERVDNTAELKKIGVEFIDVKGRLILPGFLNAHHHLYSFLAAGISPRGDTRGFRQILENLWWKLDLSLDEETTYYSALMGLIDSIKHGVTMVFDHHASMNYVSGSLEMSGRAFEKTGIKGLVCFETSNRRGREEALKHIDENVSFFQRNSTKIKGVMGLHANFTLDDSLLDAVRDARPEGMPIHIHCGEDSSDTDFCVKGGFRGPVHRLYTFGLLDSKSILAHAIHLNDEDYALINKIRPVVVVNPESNANNRVGSARRKNLPGYVFGTDGMSGDMVQTLRSGYLLGDGNRESLKALGQAFFQNRYEVQKKFFRETGELRKGNRADIAVLDYVPLSPSGEDNIIGHLIFGAKGGKVFMTVSDGEILYRDGKITFLNEEEENKRAVEVAKELHRRYYSMEA